MWAWASLAGKQAGSRGMVPWPFRYRSRLERGLWYTAKPSLVKKVCQKGSSSQKFRHRGNPIFPRLPGTGL
jgi:hypothetical protein